jgi:hypothetical protein
MTRKDEERTYKRIAKLKLKFDQDIDRLGTEKLMEILMVKFALNENQASDFMDLISEMVPDVSYEAIPEDWFFEVRVHRVGDTYSVSKKDDSKRGGPIRCKSLKKFTKDIREERDIIRDTIRLTWKLSDEKKHAVIERWKEEYRGYLNKIPVTLPDNELKVLSATDIANRIVAKRYSSTESSIESYAKLGSSKSA